MIKSVKEGEGLLAVIASLKSLVLEDEDFALLADLTGNNTILFSIANKAFYLPNSRSTGRIYYKDYKTLIEMAKKEFAGAVLSKEERNAYNLD